MIHAPNGNNWGRRATAYVDKILKGTHGRTG
jgi:hypothetical protein